MYLPKRRRNYHLVGALDPDAIDYFNAAGITNTVEQNAWNKFVVAAKANDFWDRWDRVYPFSPTSNTAALYCAKSLIPMESVGAEWTTDGYETNDGKGYYLKTAYACGDPGNSFDNHSFSIVANLFNAVVAIFGQNTIAGVWGPAPNFYKVELNFTDDLAVEVQGLNNNTSAFSASTYGNPTSGFFAVTRVDNKDLRLVVNDEEQGSDLSNVSGSLPNVEWLLGARNFNGTPVQEYDGNLFFNFAAFGAGFSVAELETLRGMINAYNGAVRP